MSPRNQRYVTLAFAALGAAMVVSQPAPAQSKVPTSLQRSIAAA